MAQLELIGFEKKEIKDISGKVISFNKVEIPGRDCTQFNIRYEIINQENGIYSSPIILKINPYTNRVENYKAKLDGKIFVPNNSIFNLQIESVLNPDFKGKAFIGYEILVPLRISITELDRHNARKIAIFNIARFLGIHIDSGDNNEQLLKKLESLEGEDQGVLIKLLNDYLKAYEQWFQFYRNRKIKENGTSEMTTLNEQEQLERIHLIAERDRTRDILQKKFGELQLAEFHRRAGLSGITGIIENE